MVYHALGLHGARVSVLGYGGWALGEEGWPGVESREALRSLEVAFEEGITFYDTAPFYGRGLSEERIGTVLSSVRDKIILATKCGIQWDERRIWLSLSRDDILREVEGSLQRLKTDYIDLYQIHWYDQKTSLFQVCQTLRMLQAQKVIRYIGVCNFSSSLLIKARQWMDVVSCQAEYNTVNRQVEKDLLPVCQQHSISFIAYSPLAQGFLVGRPFFSETRDVRKHHPLYKSGEWKNCASSLENAFRFLLKNPAVTSFLVSMTKVSHVKENVQLVNALLKEKNERGFFG